MVHRLNFDAYDPNSIHSNPHIGIAPPNSKRTSSVAGSLCV